MLMRIDAIVGKDGLLKKCFRPIIDEADVRKLKGGKLKMLFLLCGSVSFPGGKSPEYIQHIACLPVLIA